MVCDFTALAGRTLTLWNVLDEDRMDGVPFFCFSHLMMRIEVRGGVWLLVVLLRVCVLLHKRMNSLTLVLVLGM